MTEIKLRPGTIFTSPKDGEKYQVITFAKERTSGEKMIVYQQLFEPFITYAESAENFSGRMRKRGHDKNVSRQDCETNRETFSGREINCETSGETISGCETNRETIAERGTNCFTGNGEPEEPEIHPEFRRFLDARSNTERIEILRGMRNIVDDTMINSMAVIMDVEIKDGPIMERFDELLECIRMKRQYEIERY